MRAISLRLLQAELKACVATRSCSTQTLTFYGINYVQGYGLDPVRHDIVLYGVANPAAPPLRIEDFIVALRNVEHRYDEQYGNVRYYSHPAVSIDPDPRVLQGLDKIMDNGGRPWAPAKLDAAIGQWCLACRAPQRVRVEGVPFDSRFSKIMFIADYLMKRVADGQIKIQGVKSTPQIDIEMESRDFANHVLDSTPKASLSRFWFYPGATDYGVAPRGIVLQRSDIVLLTEAQMVTRGGVIGASHRRDPSAEAFACYFSQHYEQIAASAKVPAYTELQGLFRWVTLTRILVSTGAFEASGFTPTYLLDGFHATMVTVPRAAVGIASVSRWTDATGTSVKLASCGGVTMAIDMQRIRLAPELAKMAGDLVEAVFNSRKDPAAVWWPVISCGNGQRPAEATCKRSGPSARS